MHPCAVGATCHASEKRRNDRVDGHELCHQRKEPAGNALKIAQGGIQALDPDMALTDADRTVETSAVQRERVLFRNDHGNFEAGLWDTQAINTEMAPFPWHEFSHVLEGETTITEPDGTSHIFRAGDVFFVPEGTVCSWHVPSYLRKFYALVDPSIRPEG